MQQHSLKEMKNRDLIRCNKQSTVEQKLRLEQVGDTHGRDTADVSLDC